MSNHDYNPPDHALEFSNDQKQAKYTLVLAAIAAVVLVAFLIALIWA